MEATVAVRPPVGASQFCQNPEASQIQAHDASDAWAAASWARTTIAIKRVRATLQFEDEAQDAHSRMGKELSALAEVGFARMVRPHLPQAVVEDLYQH